MTCGKFEDFARRTASISDGAWPGGAIVRGIAADELLRAGESSALQPASWTSRVARRPDSSAPCIQPGAEEACSPAKWTLPSGCWISAVHQVILSGRYA